LSRCLHLEKLRQLQQVAVDSHDRCIPTGGHMLSTAATCAFVTFSACLLFCACAFILLRLRMNRRKQRCTVAPSPKRASGMTVRVSPRPSFGDSLDQHVDDALFWRYAAKMYAKYTIEDTKEEYEAVVKLQTMVRGQQARATMVQSKAKRAADGFHGLGSAKCSTDERRHVTEARCNELRQQARSLSFECQEGAESSSRTQGAAPHSENKKIRSSRMSKEGEGAARAATMEVVRSRMRRLSKLRFSREERSSHEEYTPVVEEGLGGLGGAVQLLRESKADACA